MDIIISILIFTIIGLILKILMLGKEKEDIEKGLRSAIKCITTSNALGIPPSELPKDYDE